MSVAGPVRARRCALALTFALLAAACVQEPTRVVVVTDADLATPAEVDSIRFVVDARAIGGEVQQREIAVDGARVRFPLVLAVVHEGGALGPITIEAVGLRRGEAIVTRAARLSFVTGRTVTLALELTRACSARACELEETCLDGVCVSIDVDAETLPMWTGRDDPQSIPMGGDAGASALDAATVPRIDAGSPVPPVDAGLPPPIDSGGCVSTLSCETACACTVGCACALTCAAGGDCDAVRCSGAGSECTVEARGASNLAADCEAGAHCVLDAYGASNVRDIRCRDGATCEADCRETSSCTLKCESGASCLLHCDDDDDNCRLECRDGRTRIDCGEGVFACDRACP